MESLHQNSKFSYLTELYSSKETESVYVVSRSQSLEQLKKCFLGNDLNLVGIGSEIQQIESFIDQNEPDALIINLEDEYGDFSGYQMTKLLKLEYDLPFIVLQKTKSIDKDKWIAELNPDGFIYFDQSLSEMSKVISKAFN